MVTFRLWIGVLVFASWCRGADVGVPNGGFEEGEGTPRGWTLSGGEGRWTAEGGVAGGAHCLRVIGNGKDDAVWLSEPLTLEPLAVYQVRFSVKGLDAAGGTPVTGFAFCNRDIGHAPTEWTAFSTVCRAPAHPTAAATRLRFGQWRVSGTVCFDDVSVQRVYPLHARFGALELGSGEHLDGNAYRFSAPLGREYGNDSRPLESHDCSFNSDRWCFGRGDTVIYRHQLGDRVIQAAEVNVGMTWYRSGAVAVSASRDGGEWVALGSSNALGTLSLRIPAALLPARELRVRLEGVPVGDAAGGAVAFQVGNYSLDAKVSGVPESLLGSTRYTRTVAVGDGIDARLLGVGDALPGGANRLEALVVCPADTAAVIPVVTVTSGGQTALRSAGPARTLHRGTNVVTCAYELPGPGVWTVSLAVSNVFETAVDLSVADYYAVSYGERVAGMPPELGLWWASSGWKIPQRRPLPGASASGIRIAAARNEREAAQLVLRPTARLRGVTLRATPLVGSGGQRIGAEHVDVLRVCYVPVTQPTDATGVVGAWPDPLPPIVTPLMLEAGRNQPFWVRVYVPGDAAPGVYRGAVELVGDGGGVLARVPLEVRVFAFALPTRMTCETAFGVRVGEIFRYHGLRDAQQRREVLEAYWRDYSAHHISPYDPAPLDPYVVRWPALQDWEGGVRDEAVHHGGRSALRLQDDNPHGNVGARYTHAIAIPDGGVRLTFWYRTARPGHQAIVTLNHHDAADKWMSGRNNDMRFTGNGEWQHFERTVTHFPAGAKSCRLALWSALYADDGSTTGTVWYDELTLVDAGSGKQLVTGGDFEPFGAEELKPTVDWTAWDGAMTRAIDAYGFNSFRLRVPGLGGGTFHDRYEPELLGYGETTPEYKAALGGYLATVTGHLRARGWLDEAYVYWFDEPDPKDYAFVMNGFARLKAYAPGLRRMLTEQVEDELVGGPNLWCPVTPNYNDERAQARRAAGDDFWWYVCTGPKAPYCTLFIDHPATELRTWLWQTWQRGISGILVWETAYWTSPTAYPDPKAPQNPYEDPMGWVSGYDTPAGTRRAWGNGDGRFVYPPESCADGHPAQPVIAGPVDSIRWEMLRDGIEDYEYLAILRRLIAAKRGGLPADVLKAAEALLAVPEDITRTMTDFTKDPAPIEAQRLKVALAIEKLE